MNNRFGRMLREMRQETGRSMGELARHLGVSVPYLSDVERGVRSPLTRDRIRHVAEFLGVAPDGLLLASEESKKSLRFDLTKATETEREAMAALHRSRPELRDDSWKEILDVLERAASDKSASGD